MFPIGVFKWCEVFDLFRTKKLIACIKFKLNWRWVLN